MEFLKSSAADEACIILWDEHLDWRDEMSGATLLHVACWTGNINLFRSFCNDISVSYKKVHGINIKDGVRKGELPIKLFKTI